MIAVLNKTREFSNSYKMTLDFYGNAFVILSFQYLFFSGPGGEKQLNCFQIVRLACVIPPNQKGEIVEENCIIFYWTKILDSEALKKNTTHADL